MRRDETWCNPATGAPGGNGHYRSMFDSAASTDRLIELILEEDQEVLRQLLTTQKVVATGSDKTYFGRWLTPEERKAAAAAKKAEDAALKQEIEAALEAVEAELAELER